MKILIVEDDHLQANWLTGILSQAFPSSAIEHLRTESAFLSNFEDIATSPPDVVVMDVMLRWADLSPSLPPPPQTVQQEGYYRAGLRCKRLLANDKRTREIPVVLHTVLERADLQGELAQDSPVFYAHKASAEHLVELIHATVHARGLFPVSASDNRDGLRNQIFISYSHEDTKWLKKLNDMLKPLVRSSPIVIWDDTCIKPGSLWKEQIEASLRRAKVAVLLVSPSFLASDFIANYELPPLLEAASREGLSIIWVAVSPSLYSQTEIGKYQAANNPAKPLDALRKSDANRELVRICEQIKQATGS